MPQKDPEAYKKYQRELMKQRRARAKEAQVTHDVPPIVPPQPLEAPKLCDKPAPATKIEKPIIPRSRPAQTDRAERKPEGRALRETQAGAGGSSDLYTTFDGKNVKVADQEKAQTVGEKTRDLLDSRGWCLWRIQKPENCIIVVVRDESIKVYPQGYPVYFEDDLKKLDHMDDKILKRVHEVKKLTIAQILPGFETAVCG